MAHNTIYEFHLTSDDGVLNFVEDNSSSIRNFDKILFGDSIFDFFPHGEMIYKDLEGRIIEGAFFVENSDINAKLGVEKIGEEKFGYLENTYTWNKSAINNIKLESEHLAGNYIFSLVDSSKKRDRIASKVYKDKLISDVVKRLIVDNYEYDEVNKDPKNPKYKITPTSGKDNWYQFNINTAEFLKRLSQQAYSIQYPKSPFYTFIDASGCFHFESLEAMLNQSPVKTYEMKVTKDAMLDERYIKDFELITGGIPINQGNYINRIYAINEDGSNYTDAKLGKDVYLKNQYIKINTQQQDKFLITTDTMNSQKPYGGMFNFKLYEESDFYNLKGRLNSKYLDTCLSYRVILVVNFHPSLLAGKTISLNINKYSVDSQFSPEFAGKWLICESNHHIDDKGFPMSQLVISKPSISIFKDHLLYRSFI